MIGPVTGATAAGRMVAVVATRPTDAADARVAPVAAGARVGGRLDRDAAFLAHLLATRDGLPQTRARRRAEPQVAAGAYAAVRAIVRQPPARDLGEA